MNITDNTAATKFSRKNCISTVGLERRQVWSGKLYAYLDTYLCDRLVGRWAGEEVIHSHIYIYKVSAQKRLLRHGIEQKKVNVITAGVTSAQSSSSSSPTPHLSFNA